MLDTRPILPDDIRKVYNRLLITKDNLKRVPGSLVGEEDFRMIGDQTTNDRFEEYADWLDKRIRQWKLPAKIAAEDIVFEALGRLWRKIQRDEKHVSQVHHWLLRTARNIKLEHIRKADRFRVADSVEQEFREHDEFELAPEVLEALESSTVWRRLSSQKRYVVEQCVMLDQSPAEVARKLGMKRQTVAGWAKRTPPQLATDPIFRSIYEMAR